MTEHVIDRSMPQPEPEPEPEVVKNPPPPPPTRGRKAASQNIDKSVENADAR